MPIVYIYRGWVITWNRELIAVDYYGWPVTIANLEDAAKFGYNVIDLNRN
jgi:hypothetical protein